MDCKKTGEFICSLRKELGLTQAAMAEKLGISNRTVSKWENGDGMPDISILADVAQILGVTADELLRGEKNPVKPAEIKVTEVSNKDNINNIFHMLFIVSLFAATFGAILGGITEIYNIWAFNILFYTHWEIIFAAISLISVVLSTLIFTLAVTRLRVSYEIPEILHKASKKGLALLIINSVFPLTFVFRIIDVSRYRNLLYIIAPIITIVLCLILYGIYAQIITTSKLVVCKNAESEPTGSAPVRGTEK